MVVITHTRGEFFKTIIIIFIFTLVSISILFNSGENLIETAYEFQQSIIKGNTNYAW